MKTITLVLAFVAVTAAQKALKKHKPAYIASSPGGGSGSLEAAAAPAYQQAAAPQHPSISNHGGFGGGGGGHGHGGGLSGKAPVKYPLILSDHRTLAQNGFINYKFEGDNGLKQGEEVDPDGTRRGFYSYPGADGKLITVKYTAGKNGFVAEGPHLPTQPQLPTHNTKQESHDIYSSPHQGSSFGNSGHYSAPAQHNNGQYRPQAHHGGHGGGSASVYSHSSGGAGGSSSFANFPDFSSHFPSSSSGHGGTPSYSSGAGRYSGAGAHHGGSSLGLGGAGGQSISAHPGGSQSFSSIGALGGPGSHGGASLSNLGASLGSAYSGPMFTNANPYQPSLAAATAPVNAGFDLGNGGHFSINFTPGVGQEYNVGDNSGFSGHQGGGAQSFGGGHGQSFGSGASGHGGAQGRY